MKPRFDALLPFYANGTLSDSDRAWVENYLREHPKAAAELRWYESLRTKLLEDMPPVAADLGLERTLARIRAESASMRTPADAMPRAASAATPSMSSSPAPRKPVRREPTLGERLRGWLASLAPQPILRPALAVAFAVVLAQAIVIAHFVDRSDESSEMRAIKGGAVVDQGPYLKVNFKAEARESEIRMLLVGVQGSLAAGPGQLGDYYLRVPAANLSASSDKLKASAIVDSVAVVDGLPPRAP